MRIAVFNTFDITPAENGGEIRLLNIYRRLSATNEVRVVSYDLRCKRPVRRERVPPALDIVDTQVTDDDRWAFYQANERLGLYPHDILCADLYAFSRDFLTEVDSALAWADVVVATHPYLAPHVFPRCTPRQLRILEAHNNELRAKTAFFRPARDRPLADRMIAATRRCEGYALATADIVLTVSADDSRAFVEDYAVDPAKLHVVANGVSVAAYDTVPAVAVAAFRAGAGLAEADIGVFLGSAYGPNVDSYRLTRGWLDAAGFTGHILLIGRIADVRDSGWPAVGFTEHWLSFVDEPTKRLLVRAADFALQIVTGGGGTNLKLFDYMAAAVPVIANAFGRRGVTEDGWFLPVETPADMARLVATRGWASPRAAAGAQAARAIALRDFDWNGIVQTYRTILA